MIFLWIFLNDFKKSKPSSTSRTDAGIAVALGAESLFSTLASVTQCFHNIFISPTDRLHGGISVSVFVFIAAYCF